jgi:protein ImuA
MAQQYTSTMNHQLRKILQQPNIWQGSNISRPHTGLSSGYSVLDTALHCGGWPRHGLTEIIYASPGIGEMQLLSPALAHLSQQQRWLLLVSPPYLPYAPAWASHDIGLSNTHIIQAKQQRDKLWAIEQALNSGACSAVLAWMKTGLAHHVLQKLQLAAQANHCWMVLFRPRKASLQHSPAELRMELKPGQDSNNNIASQPISKRQGLKITILKQRGGWSGQELYLDLHTDDSSIDNSTIDNTGIDIANTSTVTSLR